VHVRVKRLARNSGFQTCTVRVSGPHLHACVKCCRREVLQEGSTAGGKCCRREVLITQKAAVPRSPKGIWKCL